MKRKEKKDKWEMYLSEKQVNKNKQIPNTKPEKLTRQEDLKCKSIVDINKNIPVILELVWDKEFC